MTTPQEIADIANTLRQLAAQLDALAPTAPIEPRPPVPGETVLAWDARLSARGVKIDHFGDRYSLIQARYLPPGNGPGEAQGRTLIFVDVRDRNGKRKVGAEVYVEWPGGGYAAVPIEEKPGEEYGGSFVLSAAGHSYTLRFYDWTISGMGLGTIEEPNIGHHVSYAFVFKER